MKFFGQNSLNELLVQIKNYFIRRSEAEEASTIDIDSAPTSDSQNLVTSGGVKTALNAKQDTLTSQTAYSAKGSATKVPQITTNNLGQVTGITEVTITQPTVNNAKLSLQVNGTEKASFTANASSAATFNITAADLGLSSALTYLGIAQTTVPTAGQYINTTLDGTVYYGRVTTSGTATLVNASNGQVLKQGNKEYVCTTGGAYGTNVFTELGDEGSYVIKGTSISGGGHTHSVTGSVSITKVVGTTITATKVSSPTIVSITPATNLTTNLPHRVTMGATVTASKATAGSTITCDDITAWTTNTPTAVTITVNGSCLELDSTPGIAAALSYSAKSIPTYTFSSVTVPIVSSLTEITVAKAGTAVTGVVKSGAATPAVTSVYPHSVAISTITATLQSGTATESTHTHTVN